jgi:surface polysaccharide O-acyltransferase-like enzyme
MFYSVGFLLVFLVADRDLVTMERLWKALLPLATTTYWFVAAYLVLYLLSPFLNRLANVLTRTDYKRLLIVLFVMLSVVPTVAPLVTSPSITSVDFVFAWLPWFAFLYLLAGYFKRYQFEPFSRQTWGVIFLADTALMLAGMFAIQWLGRLGISYLSPEYFRTLSVVPALVFSVSLFYLFKNLGLRHNRLINTIAGTTFGVYLIHDNQFVAEWLWRQFQFSYAFPPLQFWLFACLVAVGVFCVSSAVEYLRTLALERPGFALLERHASARLDGWDAWMNVDDVAGTGSD